jgi:hypothetical protein
MKDYFVKTLDSVPAIIRFILDMCFIIIRIATATDKAVRYFPLPKGELPSPIIPPISAIAPATDPRDT